MKKLIISGDDFGFCEAYNHGMLQTFLNGIMTTFSLMVNMPGTNHAIQLYKDSCSDAPIILHVNFVQNRPISNPKRIPSLVNKEGMFFRSFEWKGIQKKNSCEGHIVPDLKDLCIEIRAQIEHFKKLTGKLPIHMDCHSAMTPEVHKAFCIVGKEYGIHNPSLMQDYPEQYLQISESCLQIPEAGFLPIDWVTDRFNILTNESDIMVLHFHPGYIDQYILDNTSLTIPRCRDQSTLQDDAVKNWIKSNDIQLVSFRDVL